MQEFIVERNNGTDTTTAVDQALMKTFKDAAAIDLAIQAGIVKEGEIVATVDDDKPNKLPTDQLRQMQEEIRAIQEDLGHIDDALPTKTVEGEAKEAHDVIDGEDARACGDKNERAIEEAETKAFADYIRGVVSGNVRSGELAPANNGAIIPKTIAKKINELVYDVCPILDRSEKFNVKGKLELPYYPADSSTQITVAFASEFTDLTSSTGNFTTIELDGYLAGALTKISSSV